MTASDNGREPAYPCKIISTTYPGLTKREAMAMHICAGLVGDSQHLANNEAERTAELAVEQADALIWAINRDRKETTP